MSKSRKKDKHKGAKINKAKKVARSLKHTKMNQAEAPLARLSERIIVSEGQWVSYDENLLERSRTQWQFGDWESLVRLDRNILQHHPDRAKLALLAAAGRLQLGDIEEARQYIQLAQEWGCSKRLISQILVSGVHNSLGRASAIMGCEQDALAHFSSAVALGAAGSDVKLLTQARVVQQYNQIGHPLSYLPVGTSEKHLKEGV